MDKTVGVLGGGQLGRMLTEAANRLNIQIVTLDAEGSPAKQINAQTNHVIGSFTNSNAIRRLARECDILTVETEHVNTDVLEELTEGTETRDDWRLVRSTKVEVQPSWRTIRVIQDKFHQKEHLVKLGINTAKFRDLENSDPAELKQIARELGYPLMLKSRTGAYDGRGNYPVKRETDVPKALAALRDLPLYAEQWSDFKAELAVMVVKVEEDVTEQWQEATLAYPVVETVHEDSICKSVYAPARHVLPSVMEKAQNLAQRAVAGFWGKGVFGVEMFLLQDDNLLINEIAPRPHNSGHYTIEACPLSQYDSHLRAILDLPIPPASLQLNTPSTSAIMLNILGGTRPDSHLNAAQAALSVDGASVHLYGKGDARPQRKMGHVTVLAGSMKEAERRVNPLVEAIDKLRAEPRQPQIGSMALPAPSAHPPQITSGRSEASGNPLVSVTMGSDSDRFVLRPGIDKLKEFDIPYDVNITSAHRTPDLMATFAREAASRGVKVIIAAAGGAAHLPGMIAPYTTLPVIGVPVKGSVLDGLDSLYSIVQMPAGVPVAAVGINNSTNAALLAVRILAASDVNIRRRYEDYVSNQEKTVRRKNDEMRATGIENYTGKP